jgi:hypothetical protein
MTKHSICFLLLGSLWCAPGQKGKFELEVVTAEVHRENDQIAVDGTVKNIGEKPLEGVQVILDFLSSDKRTVTKRKGPLDTPLLAVGEEASFRFVMADEPRAVLVRIEATDRHSFELRVSNSGPFAVP